MLTVEPMHVALFCFALSLFITGILIGGFVEWNKPEGTRELRRQLRDSYRETEELREYIWLVTTGSPTTQSLTKAEALPTQSVKVERLRHLNTVEDN